MISKTTLYIIGLLVFGSLNTLTTKIQFELSSVGMDGNEKHFKKPWFGTLTMFLGMVIVLGIHFINVMMRKPKKGDDIQAHLLESATKKPAVKEATFWQASKLIAIPAILDLIATALCFVGILYNSASVFQMLRGSMIIFSACLSVIFLRKKLHSYHWAGVGICCLAIVLVGYSNMMASSAAGATSTSIPQSKVVFGMALIVLGQVIQASQVVLEEKLLRGYTIEPFQIVGMEGVWGSLAMLLVFFPILYLMPGSDAGGSQENLMDTIVMMSNNKSLQYLVLLYVFSVFTYNMSGMLVTYALSAVHRTMLEASRTAVIWIVDLVIHYWISPNSSYGETWSTWSWLQLAGFALLILGQSVYSELVKLPGFYYPPRPIVAQIESIQASPASVRYNMMIPEGAESDEERDVVLVVDDERSKGI
jgi:drug/metabolite transporter (DMT)-like permease